MSREDADALAARLLGPSRTKLGDLQIEHARRVADGVEGAADRVVAAALLHDVLEKSPTTAAELLVLTGDADLVDLVVVLTQAVGEADEPYLARCARHPVALLLKRLDLLDKLRHEAHAAPDAVTEAHRLATERLALLERLAGRR